jgi:hypothetical protein
LRFSLPVTSELERRPLTSLRGERDEIDHERSQSNCSRHRAHDQQIFLTATTAIEHKEDAFLTSPGLADPKEEVP